MQARESSSVGKKVSLEIKPEEGKTLSNIKWTIGGADNTTGGFNMEDEKTIRTPLVLRNEATLQFFWCKAGTVLVTAQASVGGVDWKQEISFTVAVPQIIKFDASVGVVKIDKIQSDYTEKKVEALTFGGVTVPGFKADIKVGAPADTKGEFAITQIMTINRKSEYEGDEPDETKTSNGNYVLDEEVFYGISENLEDEPVPTMACDAGRMIEFMHQDSPASILSRDEFRGRILKSTTVDDKFITYLMFKPDNGIWVAIANIEWFWKGSATWSKQDTPGISTPDDENGNWDLTDQDWSRAPKSIGMVQFPDWKGNRYRIM